MEIALIVLGIVSIGSLGINGYLGHKLYQVTADAFLASKANSAQDLATAQNQKMAAATEIALLQKELAKLGAPSGAILSPPAATEEIKTPDGRVLRPLR